MPTSNTPYDDVFRTLLNDCSQLIIPIINEVFGEHFSGDEKIVFSPNEHFINMQDGEEAKRVTDAHFAIYGYIVKMYHFECQSTPDNSMLVRFFEYDSQIALDGSNLVGNTLKVKFPHSAVLFLRCNQSTPDKMTIEIETPNGAINYDIQVLKSQNYTIDEIFDKKLLFLIPFHIFSHEKLFEEYENDTDKLNVLKREYQSISERLEQLLKQGEIDEYTKCTILDMSQKVLEHIAAKFDNVKKGVKSVMGGQILEYEAKTILNIGRSEGRILGIDEGRILGIDEGRILGQDEERNRINQLNQNLRKDGRLEDLFRSLDDEEFQKKLLKEYNL